MPPKSDQMRANGARVMNKKIMGDIGGVGNKSSEQSEYISNDSSFMTGKAKVEPFIANDGPIDVEDARSSFR